MSKILGQTCFVIIKSHIYTDITTRLPASVPPMANSSHKMQSYRLFKNSVKMKIRRAEKTVRRSFIYMRKASKTAVKRRK